MLKQGFIIVALAVLSAQAMAGIYNTNFPKPVNKPGASVSDLLAGQQAQNKKRTVPNAMLFVSFSMSDLELKQYMVQSKHYQIPLAIRGLINNSFKQTASKIYNLTKQKNMGGMALDPMWFLKFGIKQVPALVLFSKNSPCKHQKFCTPGTYDVIYGNIPMKQQLEEIRDHGNNANQLAARILEEHDHD